MVDRNDAHLAQAAVFCVELHAHIELIDGQASSNARRLRAQMGQQGRSRKPELIASLQEDLRALALERRRVLDMLTAIGHYYPCRHAVIHPEE